MLPKREREGGERGGGRGNRQIKRKKNIDVMIVISAIMATVMMIM